MHLRPEERDKVSAAVIAAEATTDGEIVAIVADSSDAYHDVVLHWATLVMFLAAAVIAVRPEILAWARSVFDDGWAHNYSHRELLTVLLLILAAKFLVWRFIIGWRPLRMAMTPGATKSRRVRRRAIMLFKACAEGRTASRTGVLLYLSLAEHRAEIVADAAIHGKVAPEAWGEAMAALIDAVRDGRPGDGMATAVERIGVVLAKHFPRTGADPNELPDRLIEL